MAALALAGCAVVCSASAGWAQTVIVTHAPAGTTVEVVRDVTLVASAVADADGVAKVPVPEAARLKQDIDGLLYVDACPDRQRVIILERHRPVAPLEANCTRQEITGLFLVKPISTLSIDFATSPPRLLLRQGRFDPTRPAHLWAQVPLGLAFSGAAGIDGFSDPKATACGTAPDCSDDGIGTVFAGGVAVWVMKYVGGEVTYLRPGEWTAEGTGVGYRFNSTMDAEMLMTTALVGGPIGPTRLYGKVGGNYHRATHTMTETIDAQAPTASGQPSLVQGGTFTTAYRTEGWGWAFGGGFEFWLSRYLAAYTEANFAQLRGGDPDGGEGAGKDRVTTILGGVKLHIGRK